METLLCIIYPIQIHTHTPGFVFPSGTGCLRSPGSRNFRVSAPPPGYALLQAIQNVLTSAVTKTPKHHQITPVLKTLHWLKIPERIEYKVISLTYNTLQSAKPSYLHQLLTIQPPSSTRSSSTLTLLRPSVTRAVKSCQKTNTCKRRIHPCVTV